MNGIDFAPELKGVVTFHRATFHVAQNGRQVVLFFQRPMRVIATGRLHRARLLPPHQEFLLYTHWPVPRFSLGRHRGPSPAGPARSDRSARCVPWLAASALPATQYSVPAARARSGWEASPPDPYLRQALRADASRRS